MPFFFPAAPDLHMISCDLLSADAAQPYPGSVFIFHSPRSFCLLPGSWIRSARSERQPVILNTVWYIHKPVILRGLRPAAASSVPSAVCKLLFQDDHIRRIDLLAIPVHIEMCIRDRSKFLIYSKTLLECPNYDSIPYSSILFSFSNFCSCKLLVAFCL